MKIYYNNAMSQKMTANVWVNDKQYSLSTHDHLDLNVQRGDKVQYKVGKFSAKRAINYQSPTASFSIEPDKKLQGIYIAIMVAVLLLLWYMKSENSPLVYIILIAAIIGYEAVSYFRGYMARPMH
ncbi:hypothetical protein [Lacticaseibacillus sp. N501-2]|uniref:hypothetical protein n=1 Tax=Lacticaseibacillus salsurae TaxID=3367729 RepID=UPI0038B3D700